MIICKICKLQQKGDVKLILHTEIIDTYLNGNNIEKFKNHWIYNTVGQGDSKDKNIFTMPSMEDTAIVRKIYIEAQNCLADFKPLNSELWSCLFPEWKRILDNIEVYFIVGLPEPNDATVIPDPSGKNVIILDLKCWVKYYKKTNITDLIRNLITHECCHICIGKMFPQIDSDYENGTYLEKLNSMIFNEGFAHLVSYNQNICSVDWHEKKLTEVKEKSLSKLKSAVLENDTSKQNDYLYTAMFGQYYDKFGCMIGMLYIADIYTSHGKNGLKNEFTLGYKTIISRILKYY